MSKNILNYIIISLLTAVVSIGIYHFWINPQKIVWQEIEKAKFVRENEVLLNGKMNHFFRASTPDDFTETAQKSREAVVFIKSIKKADGTNLAFQNNYTSTSGSGIIISSDGLIVSNHHVIYGADEIIITLNDNREYEAELLGFDEATDLALLKINAENLPFLFFGNSDSLQVGEWVLAIGNPFKLQSTVTAGIVSAKARNINLLSANGIESFIQTDAAVNPGNSGGALVNTQGLLVGVISALMSESGRYEGFSFAIPASLAQKVIYDIQEYGSVQRAWLGVTILPVDFELAKEYKLDKVEGVYIQRVNKNSAAADAGIEKGDIIVKVDDSNVLANADFMELIARRHPGEKVTLSIIRNGNPFNVEVTLKNSINTYDFISIRRDKLLIELGVELRDLNSDELIDLGINAVYVVSVVVDSKLNRINLEPGYIVTHVNGKRINSVDDFIAAVEKSSSKVRLDGFYKNYPGKFPYVFEK